MNKYIYIYYIIIGIQFSLRHIYGLSVSMHWHPLPKYHKVVFALLCFTLLFFRLAPHMHVYVDQMGVPDDR